MTLEPLSMADRRARGAYYTPVDATDVISEWAVRDADMSVLEPSFGDGAFLASLTRRFAALGRHDPEIYGVELDPKAHVGAITAGLVRPTRATNADFTTVNAHPVTAAVGNPPFVRLRHLDEDGRASALAAAELVLGERMDPSGSLWMPIVLHAATFVRLGGRMAWVLPFEATHVRYAKPFWSYLARNFGVLEVVRVRERVFPSILQDVIILMADQRGGRTSLATFRWFGTRAGFVAGREEGSATIDLVDVANDRRPFERAITAGAGYGHVPVTPVGQLLETRIGYVSGDKRFFHPSPDDVQTYSLPASSLRATIASSRMMAAVGLRTSQMRQMPVIFAPSTDLSEGELEYIAEGERRGVNDRYKCRIRDPWYRVPLASPAELVFTVFGESPRPIMNDAGLLAANSLLTGRLRGRTTAEQFIAGWYTSLTRLSLLRNVHALGGGMMIMIPGELNRIEMPVVSTVAHLPELDELVAAGRIDDAYRLGDQRVLVNELGLTSDQVEDLRARVVTAERWRRRQT